MDKNRKTSLPALLASVLALLLVLIQWLSRGDLDNPVFVWLFRVVAVLLLLLFAAYIVVLLRVQNVWKQKLIVVLYLLGILGGFGAAFYSLLTESEDMGMLGVFFAGLLTGIVCLRLLLKQGEKYAAESKAAFETQADSEKTE